MKKIFNIRIVVLFLALLVQFSCNDYLELLPPNGLVREEFWKSKEDVEAVLMGAYQAFSTMDGNLFTQGEARGDMVQAHEYFHWSNEYKLMTSNIFPENDLCKWDGFYKVINYCNEVIKNAPEVQKVDNTFTNYQLQGLLAEAQFLRSLSYFYLVRIFKDVPLVLAPSETDGVDFYPHQTSGEEVLKVMKQNLNDYYTFATDGYKTPEEIKGRATKASFDALLADISLWNFEYEDCIHYSDRILADIRFQLMPRDKWFELYYPGNSLESIFEFQFNDKLNQKNSTFGKTNQYANQFIPSQHAVELFAFEFAVEIVRGERSSIAMISEDNFIIWKFAGRLPDGPRSQRTGDVQNSCNWIVYRLADIYLMKAEALSQIGRYNESLVLLNEIRDRAGVPLLALGNSPIEYEDAILNERALELAFEGKRWFDLLRMGRRNNYARKAKLIELIVANVPSTQKRILSAKLTNPLGWYLPVHKDEIERNKNLVQNSYYIF